MVEANDLPQRKIIAVIMSKPSKHYQTGLLKGIYSVAFKHNCNVAVFGSTNPRDSESAHDGEMSIYKLINYDKLAGVIYVPDTVIYEKRDEIITEPFLRAVREKNVPAVTIDLKYDGIPCYLCDDTSVVKAMVSHMIEAHGCRDIAYMTGKKGHPHAAARLNGFREAMREHGLEIQPNREYYGDFWYTSGEAFCDFVTSAPNGMPEAIVCGCGPMAESVYKGLRKRGYSIPRDIKLAGFEEAVPRAPFISSTNRRTDSVGKAACEGLFKLINGESVPESIQVSSQIICNFQLTCGCVLADDYDILELCGADIDAGSTYFSEYNTMKDGLTSMTSTDEMLWCLDYFSYYLRNFKGLYLCMCDGWNDPVHSLDESRKTKCFTPEMVIYYKHYYDAQGELHRSVGDQERFSAEDMFPLLTYGKDEPMAYVLRAIHFQDRVFGYAAITFGDRLQTPVEDFDYWINDISTSIESLRRLNNARYLYSKVQLDAITDGMTGLYNRNGFNAMFSKMLEQAEKSGLDTAVILADLNGLKYVNDTFGHVEGDEIIKTAARAMSECSIPGAVSENNFRIGGDEFVKVAYGHLSDRDVADFRSSLEKYLENYNSTTVKPYKVYIPIGVKLCRPGEPRNPDALLSEADKLMYSEKLRIKTKLGIAPDER